MTKTIPVAGVCGNCHVAVRPSEAYTYVEAVVWEQITKTGKRVVSRQTTGRVRCTSCQPGVVGEQEQLL